MSRYYRFSSEVRKAAWEKAKRVLGRDPSRWRYDVTGVPVLKALKGKNGLCGWTFDHIIPVSKAGDTVASLSNCQILQSLTNIRKSNNCLSQSQLKELSCDIKLNEPQLDFVEIAVHGNVKDEMGKMKCTCVSESYANGVQAAKGTPPYKLPEATDPPKCIRCEELRQKVAAYLRNMKGSP